MVMIFFFIAWLMVAMIYYFVDYCSLSQFDFSTKNSVKSKMLIVKKDHIVFNKWSFWNIDSELEVAWTVLSGIFLMCIAIPSLVLIYDLDKYTDLLSSLSYIIKVIGHQWYWVYEYKDFFCNTVEVDSLMLLTDDIVLMSSGHRLLDVDNRLYMVEGQYWRFLVSSGDVIHSWAVPSLGVKIDACPGSLNSIFVSAWSCGVFYGQCSEICGMYHAFMPMVVEVVDLLNFFNVWPENL